MKRTGCFFAGLAQNIQSMEVVPPQSKTNLLSRLFGTLIISLSLILQQRAEQCDLCLALMIGSHATHCPSWQFPSNSNLELKHYKGPFSLPEWRLNPRRLSARLLGLLLASATLARNVTFPKRARRLLNGLSWDYNNPREAVTFPPNPRPADWNLGGMSAKPEGAPIKNQQWICLVTTFFMPDEHFLKLCQGETNFHIFVKMFQELFDPLLRHQKSSLLKRVS